MTEISKELKGIKNELGELRLIYKQLAEKVIPVVKPDKEEENAIEDNDELVTEETIMKTLK